MRVGWMIAGLMLGIGLGLRAGSTLLELSLRPRATASSPCSEAAAAAAAAAAAGVTSPPSHPAALAAIGASSSSPLATPPVAPPSAALATTTTVAPPHAGSFWTSANDAAAAAAAAARLAAAPLMGDGGGVATPLNASAILAMTKGPIGRNLTRWQRRNIERARQSARDKLRYMYEPRDRDSEFVPAASDMCCFYMPAPVGVGGEGSVTSAHVAAPRHTVM